MPDQVVCPEIRVKTPTESLSMSVDVSRLFVPGGGETVSALSSVVDSAGVLAISGSGTTTTTVYARIGGGVAGTQYTITWTFTTSASNTRVVVSKLAVRSS